MTVPDGADCAAMRYEAAEAAGAQPAPDGARRSPTWHAAVSVTGQVEWSVAVTTRLPAALSTKAISAYRRRVGDAVQAREREGRAQHQRAEPTQPPPLRVLTLK